MDATFWTFWHDSVWSKVIAFFIGIGIVELYKRIRGRKGSLMSSLGGLLTSKSPMWTVAIALVLVYLGTHFTTFDFYIYLVVLMLILVFNDQYEIGKAAPNSNPSTEIKG